MDNSTLNNIKVLLVDDHQLFLDGLKSIFKHVPYIQIVAEALNGKSALDLLKTNSVDIIISDVSMPEMSGEILAHRVLELYPQVKILTLSMHNDFANIERMINAGIQGYLMKNTGRVELLEAINALYKGENYFSKEVKDIMVNHLMKKAPINDIVLNEDESDNVIFLSSRERQIIRLILDGNNFSDISSSLLLAESTIESHMKNIFSKLKINSVTQLIDYINRKKIVI
jgi:two-component system, NarL family, nitrate/nitrite response regulator NarL